MRDELGWAVSGPVGGLAFSAANALAELDGPAGFKIDARLLFLVAFGAVLSVASVVMPLDRRGFFLHSWTGSTSGTRFSRLVFPGDTIRMWHVSIGPVSHLQGFQSLAL